MSQERNKDSFEVFNELIEKDSELPANLEIVLLKRYFKVCEEDSTKALELLKSNLKMRKNGPQIFQHRDVLSTQIQTVSKILQVVPLPKLTKDNKRIFFARFTTSNTSQYSCVDSIKMMLMMLDVRYSLLDEDKLADSDILILDLQKYTFRHFLNDARNPKTLFLYFKYIQETVPIITTAAHILNPSWVVDRLMSLIRPFLRKEVADSFRFHSSGTESLHNFVPKEILPVDYGGNLGNLDDLHQEWMNTFESKRDYLLKDDNWKIAD